MSRLKIWNSATNEWEYINAPNLPQVGVTIVNGPFMVNYNDANLNDGIEFYTPSAGDILVAAMVEIETTWDGTTPKLDIGQGNGGIFREISAPNGIYLDADTPLEAGDGFLLYHYKASTSYPGANHHLPGRVTTTTPFAVWVSEDGLRGGADPGATQGAARVYLVIATPKPF